MTQSGSKKDTGKLRYDLIPAYPLERLAVVYTIGAAKYDDWNWLKGFNYSQIYAAIMRHVQAWWMGRSVDLEDGQHPLASVAWGVFALMELERLGAGTDDRPHNLVQTTIQEEPLFDDDGLFEGSHEEWLNALSVAATQQTKRDKGRNSI